MRASSPGLIVLYQDPKCLQVVRAPMELLRFGATSCAVQNDPTPLGETPKAESVHVSAAAAVVDQAWEILSKE